MSEPKISIITATYNNGEFLADTIRSVLGQTYTNWEWIAVDNGSIDETQKIFSTYKDDRINYIRLPSNLGVSGGRNRALMEASGEFICFLDGDDLLPSESLKSRAQVLITEVDVDFVDGSVYSFTHTPSELTLEHKPSFSGNPLNELLNLNPNVFFGSTWMYRRKPTAYKFLDGMSHAEDLLFYISISNNGLYSHTDGCVLHYRRHQRSAMKNLDGLYAGYKVLIREVNKLEFVRPDQVVLLKRKVRSIMIKSFLRRMRFGQALRVLVERFD
ncbi:MAG: glycosyltransferase family 2 protein [Salibacteraceae bacterium]